MKTNTVTTLSTAQQRNRIARLVELAAIIDGAKDEYDEIIAQFKDLGDGDYLGRDGRKVQVRTTESNTLDTKIAKGFLTVDEIAAATKTVVRCTAKLV